MAAHLRVDRYDDFVLTDAVRPGLQMPVVPREGFRFDVYRDAAARLHVPVLAASVSREKLFDTFVDLLAPLGETVDVVLETSHHCRANEHRDLFRDQIDLPVLTSHLFDFEDLLLNDGCAGVAVLSTVAPMEVQFDEHKLLIVYAHDLEPFERVLRQWHIPRHDTLKLITEGEHLHSTDPRYLDLFEQLCCRLGVAEPAEPVNW
jgi:hypothetical protein